MNQKGVEKDSRISHVSGPAVALQCESESTTYEHFSMRSDMIEPSPELSDDSDELVSRGLLDDGNRSVSRIHSVATLTELAPTHKRPSAFIPRRERESKDRIDDFGGNWNLSFTTKLG